MHTFPTTFVEASGFLSVLLDCETTVDAYVSADAPQSRTKQFDIELPIQPQTLNHVVELHALLDIQNHIKYCTEYCTEYCTDDSHVAGLSAALHAASFLQLDLVHPFLVLVLNRLCQYDDVRLPLIEASI